MKSNQYTTSFYPERPPRTESFKDFRSRGHRDQAFSTVQTGYGIFKLIFMSLLIISVFRLVGGFGQITFTSFLERLSSAPAISFDWLHVFDFSFVDTAPAWLEWFASILDTFLDLFKSGMFVGTAVLNCLSFLLYFLRWIFLG